MELIDTHTHLTAPDFDGDREEVIARAKAASITKIINIGAGYGIESAKLAIQLASQYDFIYATVGVHPHDAKIEVQLDILRKLSENSKVVAIGETGLDFFRDWAPKDLQEKWFRAQIELALEVKKPLVIHSRDAAMQCYQILKEMNARNVGGVFHCYSEDSAFVEKLSELNFLISIPGSISFKKAAVLRQVVRDTPISQIMLETDAPYMAPEPHRGKRCESAFMLETAKVVADIKEISLTELALETSRNAIKLFKLN